ncbi:hypothetical protein CANARDRAFT_26358 [[Candida] arabinofermentans NRRL YB-2248]|uniref:Transcription factor IIIC subunit 5 HTH domain-containing protein n=1 Tax=[Candida] arabinofermentans NRRL YB-2248 TaxID=983967 RepID=A0A1E4T8Z2_9ASCO|nr:hypothetical protein CANARDRAFT_26358 [[Candida] arabinofermentans NRRL YB-2248]
MDIPPLLRYARVDVPYNYQYFGNVLVDENGIKAKSTVKLHTIFLEWGEEPPTTYPLVLQKELDKAEADVEILKKNGMERLIRESPAGYFLQCLELVKRLFEMKPIWIRRHINWMLPPVIRPQLRFVLPYVSYSMKKGPWRQSYIKFGYDPTKDPNAWAYQVEGFRSCVKSVKDIEIYKMFENDQESGMIVPNSLKKYADQLKDPSPEIKQFEFLKIPKQLFYDGVNPTSAVSFQFIDMTDDDVNTILSHRQQSQVCYEKTGWIDWITLCRLRSVIKYKLNCIKNGKTMDQNRISHLMNARTFKSIDSKQLIPPEDDEDIGDDNDDTNIAGGDDGDGGLDEGSDGDEVQSDTNMANSGDFDLSNNGLDVSKDDLIARLKTFNPGSIRLLDELDGLLKQESIMKLEE